MAAAQNVKEFFKGKNVFMTGGSGFIGKALIEKLLRSCPDIGHIYMLLRPKKGKCIEERLEQIISSPLFGLLKQKDAHCFKKIIPIKGDVAANELGISAEDRQMLIQNVHLVYHTAASVRFDDFLNVAIFHNVRAAREVAHLALEMPHLEAFLHLSTTYCNIDNRKVVEEILYPPNGDWREAIRIAESVDSHVLNPLTQKYIDPFPNTYTYTKQLAEHCINDLLVGKVPTVICRPSVVISSLNEPFQGWNDNYNGPVGILLAAGTGIARTFYGDGELHPDYVSVDIVVKVMIIALWQKAVKGDKDTLPIYQACTSSIVRLKMNLGIEYGYTLRWEVPFKNTIWFPGGSMTKCFYRFYLTVLVFQVLPALFVDFLLRVTGRSPFLLKVQRKMYIANLAIIHFATNEWFFSNNNTIQMYAKLPDEEKEAFNFMQVPLTDREQYNYYLVSCDYARRHLLEEDKDITEETRIRTKRMYYLDRAVTFLFYSLMAWIVFFKINILSRLLMLVCQYWDSL